LVLLLRLLCWRIIQEGEFRETIEGWKTVEVCRVLAVLVVVDPGRRVKEWAIQASDVNRRSNPPIFFSCRILVVVMLIVVVEGVERKQVSNEWIESGAGVYKESTIIMKE
jgi:hypothetical protein